MNKVVVEAAEHQHVLADVTELFAQFVMQNGIQNRDVWISRVLNIFLTELNIRCQRFFNNSAVGFSRLCFFVVAQSF